MIGIEDPGVENDWLREIRELLDGKMSISSASKTRPLASNCVRDSNKLSGVRQKAVDLPGNLIFKLLSLLRSDEAVKLGDLTG